MAFFEKIGGAISSGVNTTASKANAMGEQNRLNSELSGKKKEIKSLYHDIGKAYVDGVDAATLEPMKANALTLAEEIEKLEYTINKNKGLKKCEHCGQIIDNASTFCAHCGGKQTERVNKCVKCRTVLADGVAFCFNCGTKQPDANAPVAAPVVEAVPAVAPVIEEVAPVVEEPVLEPVIEEPIVEEPAVEEPVMEPVVEEVAPVVEEPVVEEPAVEEPVVEEPVVEEPAVEEVSIPDFVPAEMPVIEEVEEVAKCANCGAELDDDCAFCTECGTPVKKAEEPAPAVENIFCTNCGNKEEVGTRFCSECGTKLD